MSDTLDGMVDRIATPADVMRAALDLASRGVGFVEPNPPVGAIVVDDELRLLGAGCHERFGGAHAEVHALQEAGERARGATLYVTLEPCAHFGKTPPCTEAVIRAGIRRVVTAMEDPAPHVSGRGVERLREAGVEVEVGLLAAEARRLTAPFVALMTQGRPYVHAKWAMTLDGKIASRTGHSQWITSEESRRRGHELRGRMDAILVGVNTVLADDPLLTARPPGPRVATRVVLDSRGRTPATCRLVATAAESPVLVVTTPASPPEWRDALASRGIEILVLDSLSAEGRPCVTALLQEFGRRRMTNLLVEGGGGVLGAFRDADAIDECHVFVAPKVVGGDAAVAPVAGLGQAEIPSAFGPMECEVVAGDVYLRTWREPP